MKKKVFCYECRQDVDYCITEENETAVLKEEKCEYRHIFARCNQCKSELFIDHIVDENLERLYNVYRKQNGLISLEKIKAIPKKYAIGKRPLSLLLGWGEQTFSRFVDGDMPSKQYSDILERLYEDPNYYNELLQKNKTNLKSNAAYIKSNNAVKALLGASETSKIFQLVGYILNKCEDVTPLALQKLLYYVQGFHYAFYNTFIFDDDCEAWAHGPVYKTIYHQYSNYRFDPINGYCTSIEDNIFSSSEKALMDSVIKYFGCFSGKVLEAFTHTECPWSETRAGLLAEEISNRTISKQLIGEFFNGIKTKYGMLNPADVILYARDKFEDYKVNV